MNGSLSPHILRCQCAAVGKGYKSKYLGSLLTELVTQESCLGTTQSVHGGVCSISHGFFEQMRHHHGLSRYERLAKSSFGVNLNRITFQMLAISPEISLILAGSWFLANAGKIPKSKNEQRRIISRFWTHQAASIYT